MEEYLSLKTIINAQHVSNLFLFNDVIINNNIIQFKNLKIDFLIEDNNNIISYIEFIYDGKSTRVQFRKHKLSNYKEFNGCSSYNFIVKKTDLDSIRSIKRTIVLINSVLIKHLIKNKNDISKLVKIYDPKDNDRFNPCIKEDALINKSPRIKTYIFTIKFNQFFDDI
jgi:hypothetical protein